MNNNLDKNVTPNNNEEDSSNVSGTQNSISLLDFSDEILLKILSNLDRPSHRTNVPLVCKRLKTFDNDRSLWKSLELNPVERNRSNVSFNFRKLFNIYSEVQNVTIKFCEIEETRLEILSQLTSLESLVLHECFISEILFRDQQLPFFATSPSLTSLTLVSVLRCKKLLNSIDPQHIRYLNITFDNRDDKDDFSEFIDKCRSLEDLHLDNSYNERYCFRQYDTSHINYIFKTLFETLVSVNLKNEFPIFDGAFENLRTCPKLKKLNLNCSYFRRENTLYNLTELNQLTHLKLQNLGNYANRGINNMLQTSNLSNLTTLEIIFANYLTDSNLLRIAMLCKKLLNLTLINCSRITDKGLSVFARNCQTLIFLFIDGLRGVTGRFLLDVKDQNLLKELKTLVLDGVFINWEYADSLKNSRNELIVKRNIKKEKFHQ